MNLAQKLFVGVGLIGSFTLGCKGSESTSPPPEDPLKSECQKIVSTYHSWSERLIARDFAGAMSYCVPGSNCEGRTKVHKQIWDLGGQSYDDIFRIEVWMTDDDLARGYGEVVGNTDYYQFVPNTNQGEVDYKLGFDSSVRKIGGQWEIDGINSNYDVDWWGGSSSGCQR
ncbi:MAG: hypothetical protein ABSG05_02210 [Candidatus Pacearchaeota archaeon]|jgi:hypothetical protein